MAGGWCHQRATLLFQWERSRLIIFQMTAKKMKIYEFTTAMLTHSCVSVQPPPLPHRCHLFGCSFLLSIFMYGFLSQFLLHFRTSLQPLPTLAFFWGCAKALKSWHLSVRHFRSSKDTLCTRNWVPGRHFGTFGYDILRREWEGGSCDRIKN